MTDAYDAAWYREASVLASGEGEVDIGPGVGRLPDPPIVTLVTRLPRDVGNRLHRDAMNLNMRLGGHYVYPADDIHVTTLYVGGFLNEECRGLAARDLVPAIRSALEAWEPIDFTVQGLGVFRTTVFAQVREVRPGTMVTLRERLFNSLRHVTGCDPPFPPGVDLVFANVLRFTHTPPATVPEMVEPYRGKEYGSGTIRTVELVETDKFLSRLATTKLEEFCLTG